MTTTQRRLGFVFTLAAATLIFAGCASGGATPSGGLSEEAITALGGEAAATQMKELYDAALEAGQSQVVVYGQSDPEAVAAAFQARFPGITVSQETVTGAERAARLEAESQSGNFVGDAVRDGTTTGSEFVDEGFCRKFDPIYDVPAEWHVGDGQVLITSLGVFGIAYDTQAVRESELPKTWDDLLDPRWTGKVAVVTPAQIGASTYNLAGMLVPEKNAGKWGKPYLEKLKGQVRQVGQDVLAVQSVSSGETEIAISVYYPYFLSAADQGAPIGFAFLDLNEWTGSAICQTVNSPNAEATKLYLNWRMSPEGQATIAKTGNFPVMPGAPAPDGLPPLDQITLWNHLPAEEQLHGYDQSVEEVISLFGS